jgi:hypothetical protein
MEKDVMKVYENIQKEENNDNIFRNVKMNHFGNLTISDFYHV